MLPRLWRFINVYRYTANYNFLPLSHIRCSPSLSFSHLSLFLLFSLARTFREFSTFYFNTQYSTYKTKAKKNWPSNDEHKYTMRCNYFIRICIFWFIFKKKNEKKRDWEEEEANKKNRHMQIYNQSLWNMQNLNVVDYCFFYSLSLSIIFSIEMFTNTQNHKQSIAIYTYFVKFFFYLNLNHLINFDLKVK